MTGAALLGKPGWEMSNPAALEFVGARPPTRLHPTHAQERLKGLRTTLHSSGVFTSDFTGQDFWSLLHSGYRPVEMVMGSCVYHVAHRGVFSAMARVGQNVELENFTSAMYEAREIAVERMQVEAAAAKAEGVVGVDIHEGSHGWQTHVIEFFAIGTAVSPLDQEIAPEKIADPIMVLSVND
jgi:uncharacterized protein YbjQ (UPF0145 family)